MGDVDYGTDFEVDTTGDKAYWLVHPTTIEFQVTVDANGGSFASRPPGEGDMYIESFTVESAAVSLDHPTWDGHSFGGWNTRRDGSGEEFGGVIPTGSTGDRTYYAQWSSDPYEISYNLDGGTFPDGLDVAWSYDYDTTTFDLVEPVKRGYTFVGWSDDAVPGSEPRHPVTISQGSWGNRSFTAHWRANDYAIRFDLGEGQAFWPGNEPKLEDGTTGLAAAFDGETTLPAPERAGHVFTGWSFLAEGGELREYSSDIAYGPLGATRAPLNLTSEPNGEVTLVAQWNAAIRVDVPTTVDLVALTNWASNRIEVSGGDGLKITSRTTADVKVIAITDDGIYEGGSLAADSIFKGNAASAGVTVAAATEGSVAHRVPFAGSVADEAGLSGLIVPAVGSPQGAELPVRYGLDVSGLALEDVVPWVESTPVARLHYTVAFADPTL